MLRKIYNNTNTNDYNMHEIHQKLVYKQGIKTKYLTKWF